MSKIVELPLVEPVYSTYHTGVFSACINSNPTIRNHYLNEVLILICTRKFLSNYTSPEINVEGTSMIGKPYLVKHWIPMRYLQKKTNDVIRNMIDDGCFVYFTGIDDYYVDGKSWYRERHFAHDGAICGYNQEKKTYCIYAYDINWRYQKFWTPQKSFEEGRRSMFKQGIYGSICGVKPTMETIDFSAKKSLEKINEYLDSNLIKYPENEDGTVRGIVVHEYIAKYVSKLYDGSIPYEKMDRRVFRMIWEHKKIMLERIKRIEEALGINPDVSIRYEPLVDEADNMRMMYAMHHMKRRDSMLPMIEKKLLALRDQEFELLSELLSNAKY